MAGLGDELAGPGNYTLFAPTDAAFAALPEDFLNLMLEDVEGQLKPLLLYHLVITTGAGSTPVYVNGVQIVTSDIQASNGIIHVVNAVLVP
jgi:uncharacterized surface protein with fasciclin (FAS1) repeats